MSDKTAMQTAIDRDKLQLEELHRLYKDQKNNTYLEGQIYALETSVKNNETLRDTAEKDALIFAIARGLADMDLGSHENKDIAEYLSRAENIYNEKYGSNEK